MARVNNISDLLEVYEERFKPEKTKGLDAIIQLLISGEAGGNYILKIVDGTFAYEPGIAEEPDITVESSFDDWLKVNKGEANALTMMMKGKVKIKGSVPLAMKFQSIFF
ncbi:MAG: SCP2 sterol-binding domain-containing protein [Rhodothermales bacterium]|nr:SCP2 sterol-binding domain-containing protein [Rhodothermales bacterium]